MSQELSQEESARITAEADAFVASTSDYLKLAVNFNAIARWVTQNKPADIQLTCEVFAEAWQALKDANDESIVRKLYDLIDDEEPTPAAPAQVAAPVLDAAAQAASDREDESLSAEAYRKKYNIPRVNGAVGRWF